MMKLVGNLFEVQINITICAINILCGKYNYYLTITISVDTNYTVRDDVKKLAQQKYFCKSLREPGSRGALPFLGQDHRTMSSHVNHPPTGFSSLFGLRLATTEKTTSSYRKSFFGDENFTLSRSLRADVSWVQYVVRRKQTRPSGAVARCTSEPITWYRIIITTEYRRRRQSVNSPDPRHRTTVVFFFLYTQTNGTNWPGRSRRRRRRRRKEQYDTQ